MDPKPGSLERTYQMQVKRSNNQNGGPEWKQRLLGGAGEKVTRSSMHTFIHSTNIQPSTCGACGSVLGNGKKTEALELLQLTATIDQCLLSVNLHLSLLPALDPEPAGLLSSCCHGHESHWSHIPSPPSKEESHSPSYDSQDF